MASSALAKPMKYEPGDYEAAHLHPIWRERANFIFAVHIGTKAGKNRWEQLWGMKIAANRFTLCCIPFFARGLSLGDEIETDENFVFQRVINPGDHMTFRVWISTTEEQKHHDLIAELHTLSPLTEAYSRRLIALSVLSGEQAQGVANYLQAREDQGLLEYETGYIERSLPGSN